MQSPNGPALFGTIELVSDEPAIPSEQCIGFRDIGYFLEGFASPQAFGDSASVALSLSVRRYRG